MLGRTLLGFDELIPPTNKRVVDFGAGTRGFVRNFGFTGFDTVACLGTNGKMNEVCAAMGLNSIASMGTFVEINRRHYDQYKRQMAIVPGISLALYNEGEKNNYQYIALQVERETAGLSRDDLEKILWAENVLARRYFYPGCHRMEPYRSEQPTASTHLPNTQWLAERIICLPTGSAVTSNDVASICALLSFVIKNAAAVQERLAMSGSSEISLTGKFRQHSKA